MIDGKDDLMILYFLKEVYRIISSIFDFFQMIGCALIFLKKKKLLADGFSNSCFKCSLNAEERTESLTLPNI